jgi:hypothetical protein
MLDVQITVSWDVTSCCLVGINVSGKPVAWATFTEDLQDFSLRRQKTRIELHLA